jgi:hypothetical protein
MDLWRLFEAREITFGRKKNSIHMFTYLVHFLFQLRNITQAGVSRLKKTIQALEN